MACVGGKEMCVQGLGPEGKTPLSKPRHRWEGNIKSNHQTVGWVGMWIGLIRNRWQAPVNTAVNLQVP